MSSPATSSPCPTVVEEGAPRPSRNHRRTAGRPLRPPLPGRPRRRRHRPARAGQPADHRRSGPRLVRHRRQVTVKPVLDLEAHDPVDTDVVPDRHAEVTAIRDRTCVFPWCTRTARRCDTDHTIPAARGGPTCPCNLAPLCRRHHRIKTHGGWTYTTLEPGVLSVDLEARLPVPARPRRHPRRQPRPPPRPRLATKPRTPPQSGAIGAPDHLRVVSRRLLRNLLNRRRSPG